MFSHMFDIIVLFLVALLVFGPRKMIELASGLGKALRELRDATKEMSWQGLSGDDSHADHVTPLANMLHTFTASSAAPTPPATPTSPAETVVEGSVERTVPEHAEE